MKKVFLMFAASLLFTGCGLYNKYEKTVEDPVNPFGSSQDITTATSGESIAQMSWREFFAKRLAYLPSLYFSPQGTISSFDKAKATNMYNGAQAIIALYIALGGGTK